MLLGTIRCALTLALPMLLGASALPMERSTWSAPVAVVGAVSASRFELGDGRTVRLAGVHVPAGRAAQARGALEELVAGQSVRLASATPGYDRYGHATAQVERVDGLWLQGALLERGLASVRTRPGEVARAAAMLVREGAARDARRGIWADPTFAPQEANSRSLAIGGFHIVRGRVRRVAPTERYVYLNFGADWRRDFTVRARRNDLKGALADLDLPALEGRRVEVRGVVLDAGGPLIELSHAEQLQILP